MADYILFEAEASENESNEDFSNNNDTDMDSFINDESESENENEENYEFSNVSLDIAEVNKRIEEEAIERINNCDDYSNLSYASSEDEESIFEFENSQHQIEKFKRNLFPKPADEIQNNFVNVILLKIREIFEGKTDNCLQEDLLKNEKINEIFIKLSNAEIKFSLNLQEFNNICYKANEILIKFDFFLRVFEQKNSYRQLLIKKTEKQNQIKQLASCLVQKYNGFQVIKTLFNKRQM